MGREGFSVISFVSWSKKNMKNRLKGFCYCFVFFLVSLYFNKFLNKGIIFVFLEYYNLGEF